MDINAQIPTDFHKLKNFSILLYFINVTRISMGWDECSNESIVKERTNNEKEQ